MSTDEVQRPSHYLLSDGREAFEAAIGPICDTLADRDFSGRVVYAVGNALKYLSRLGAKGTSSRDLAKAIRYLEMARAAVEVGGEGEEVRDGAPPAENVDEARDGAPLSAARAEETAAAIRAFHAAEPLGACDPLFPPGLEAAREAAGLAPFPVRGTPRKVRGRAVGPGSIVWVPNAGTPEIAVRWHDGGGAWVDRQGPFDSVWRWEAGVQGEEVWVVAEGLQDREIRAWLCKLSAWALPKVEMARVSEGLRPFPGGAEPRRVRWSEVPCGAIAVILDGEAGSPVAVRWSDGGGAWVGSSPVGPLRTWDYMGPAQEAEAWVVAEGLSDGEIREWVLDSRA